MFNSIKADYYRIFRSVGFWGVQAFCIFGILLGIFTSSDRKINDFNSGHRPGIKSGYLPVPPVDSFQDMRSEMVLLIEQMGMPVEVHHRLQSNCKHRCWISRQ